MPPHPTLFLLFYPQAFRPYKLALVSREDDGHYRESSAAAPARLTLTLLALEPGQVVAAQAQLAVALEDTGSRILRQQQDGKSCAEKFREGCEVSRRHPATLESVLLGIGIDLLALRPLGVQSRRDQAGRESTVRFS